LVCIEGKPFGQLLKSCTVLLFEVSQHRIFRKSVFITAIVEKSHELIVLFHTDRIVWMAVALYTGKSGSLQDFPGSIYPVHHRCNPKLFVVGTSLVIGHGVAVKCGGQQLIVSW